MNLFPHTITHTTAPIDGMECEPPSQFAVWSYSLASPFCGKDRCAGLPLKQIIKLNESERRHMAALFTYETID